MKTYYLYFMWACLLMSFSCSTDVLNNLESVNIKKLNIVSTDSISSGATVISSMEEFYQFLVEKSNLDSLENDYSFDYLIPNASVITITKEGYTNEFKIYVDCHDLEISFSDFQTADKLGLIANKTYFITIGQVQYVLPLENNWHPGVAESLDCGLILENPRTDNFVNAPRGYVGGYNAEKSTYTMATSLVYFLDYTDDPKIWYPCAPENLKWNVNILIL